MIRLRPVAAPSAAITFAAPVAAVAVTALAAALIFAALGKPPGRALGLVFWEPIKECGSPPYAK